MGGRQRTTLFMVKEKKRESEQPAKKSREEKGKKQS